MRLEGLFAATPTPLASDGDLNLGAIPSLIAHLTGINVRGIFVCGTTGECASLRLEERRAVAEAYIAAAGGSMPVVVHVGHDSLREAQRLAEHAAAAGASAIAAVPPVYFKPDGAANLADCCREIAAAAPDLPFFYYHYPKLTGVELPMREFLAVARDRVPSLAGVKFTHVDTMDYQRCLEFDGGRFQALFGHDGYVLAALGVGAKGFIGGAHNFAAPLYWRMWDSFKRGDKASSLKWQSIAAGMVGTFARFGNVAAVKGTLKLLGIDCGPCRLPLRGLDDARLDSLRRALELQGVLAALKG